MGELIPLKEAQERVGLSKNTLRKLIQRLGITLYENPRDARQKLIDVDDLESAMTPRPFRREEVSESKMAA